MRAVVAISVVLATSISVWFALRPKPPAVEVRQVGERVSSQIRGARDHEIASIQMFTGAELDGGLVLVPPRPVLRSTRFLLAKRPRSGIISRPAAKREDVTKLPLGTLVSALALDAFFWKAMI